MSRHRLGAPAMKPPRVSREYHARVWPRRACVRAFTWAEIGRVAGEEIGADREPTMVVYGGARERIGALEARFLDAPLGFVVAVAEAYRRAAAVG